MDEARDRAQREAYALYRRLRRLARALPEGHPVRPAASAAAEAAGRHWLILTAPPEDRLVDLLPARPRGTSW